MKVAVVGAGFSGLAVCWHLLQRGVAVDLYEAKEVGAGASGVASGLLHPYAGEQVRRSYLASQALEETKHLLKVAGSHSKEPVADFCGVIRIADEEQAKTLQKHIEDYGDVERLCQRQFLIKSGIVVHSKNYLSGLFAALEEKGLHWIVKKVSSLKELESYDAFVLTIGNGIFSFEGLGPLPLSRVKGQSLLCKWPFEEMPLKRPLVSKGHIVPSAQKDRVYLGSTYERGEFAADDTPFSEIALKLLWPRAKELMPAWQEPGIIECKAGIRVTRPGFAVPWIKKIGEKGFLLTAMSSRGLLYHSYFAKQLVEEMLQ
jgi:glycine/D-amino acid oxidase-like deaminating enzyme